MICLQLRHRPHFREPKLDSQTLVPFPSLLSLTLPQISEAWEFLASLPDDEGVLVEFCPPPHLQHLTSMEWQVLSNLLSREMSLRHVSPLH